ncbi:MAG TPA: TA system VapC family ribonuclease toxin [Acidobacteriaceae bacterium]|nr:TA system VapC family ribonuclease toxin [Acidobacteriaceae bacterium]
MTLFFPDLNVWLALSVAGHSHSREAWRWLDPLPRDVRLVFSRYTQIGLLRLLTNASVMGDQTLTMRKAWGVYDRWLEDPRVEFYPEPRGVDTVFRQVMEPFAARHASKAVGDCWLLAYAIDIRATLVTFDRALHEYARKQGRSAIIPG